MLHAFARARAVPSATALKSVFILHHHLAGGIERMEEFTLFDRDLRVRAQCPQNVLFRLWSCQALSRRRQSRFDRCGAWDCHARVHRNTLRGPRHFEGGPAPVRRRSARRISVRAGDSGTAPSLSRHANRLAYVRWVGDSNIWRIPGPRSSQRAGPPERWIASTQADAEPQYSPDGKKIVFSSGRSGTQELWTADSNGGEPAQLTSLGGPLAGSPRWSPDSR